MAFREAIRSYEKATGSVLNIGKSEALAVGTWDTTRCVLDIPYSTEIKVLSFRMTNTTAQPGVSSWTMITNTVQTQTCKTFKNMHF